MIEPQLKIPVKIGDKIKLCIRNDSIKKGAYIDFFASDDDLVYSSMTKKMHCGRVYIDIQKTCKIIFSSNLNERRKKIVSLKTLKLLEETGIKSDNDKVKGANKEEIVNAMTKKIEQLSEQNQRVSLHCVSENVYMKCNVLDISTNMNNTKDFINLLAKNTSVIKIIHPIKGISNSSKVMFDTGEGAIHVEIKQ